MARKRFPVWFNATQERLWKKQYKEKKIDKPFPEFVKGAFYKEIDRLKKKG